jgi:para-aminobenzoate synthetase component 1
MGSMTGAPKIRAMEIIEELEFFSRGLYSGSVGYISPSGDFDFNVVIRSILYNSSNDIFLYPAGGAITANSNIEKEFDECMLKAQSMKTALTTI